MVVNFFVDRGFVKIDELVRGAAIMATETDTPNLLVISFLLQPSSNISTIKSNSFHIVVNKIRTEEDKLTIKSYGVIETEQGELIKLEDLDISNLNLILSTDNTNIACWINKLIANLKQKSKDTEINKAINVLDLIRYSVSKHKIKDMDLNYKSIFPDNKIHLYGDNKNTGVCSLIILDPINPNKESSHLGDKKIIIENLDLTSGNYSKYIYDIRGVYRKPSKKVEASHFLRNSTFGIMGVIQNFYTEINVESFILGKRIKINEQQVSEKKFINKTQPYFLTTILLEQIKNAKCKEIVEQSLIERNLQNRL